MDTSSTAGPVSIAPRGIWWRAAWAGLLSLVVPGLAQIYARSWWLGVILLAALTLAALFPRSLSHLMPPTRALLLLVCVLAFIGFAVHVGAAVDAMRRIRMQPLRIRAPWYRSTWLVGGTLSERDNARDFTA